MDTDLKIPKLFWVHKYFLIFITVFLQNWLQRAGLWKMEEETVKFWISVYTNIILH